MFPEVKVSVAELSQRHADSWPGFPPEVHHIMALIQAGKTPEEAAAIAGGDGALKEFISKRIEEVEQTKARRNPDGTVELPPNILIEEIVVGDEPAELNRNYDV